jgi:hypothetical protein
MKWKAVGRPPFLTSAADGGVSSLLTLAALVPGKNPRDPYAIESYVSLRAGLDILKIKISFAFQQLDPVPSSCSLVIIVTLLHNTYSEYTV